jgi:hypothetical protein
LTARSFFLSDLSGVLCGQFGYRPRDSVDASLHPLDLACLGHLKEQDVRRVYQANGEGAGAGSASIVATIVAVRITAPNDSPLVRAVPSSALKFSRNVCWLPQAPQKVCRCCSRNFARVRLSTPSRRAQSTFCARPSESLILVELRPGSRIRGIDRGLWVTVPDLLSGSGQSCWAQEPLAAECRGMRNR